MWLDLGAGSGIGGIFFCRAGPQRAGNGHYDLQAKAIITVWAQGLATGVPQGLGKLSLPSKSCKQPTFIQLWSFLTQFTTLCSIANCPPFPPAVSLAHVFFPMQAAGFCFQSFCVFHTPSLASSFQFHDLHTHAIHTHTHTRQLYMEEVMGFSFRV